MQSKCLKNFLQPYYYFILERCKYIVLAIRRPRKYGRNWWCGCGSGASPCGWQCHGWGKLSPEQAGGKCLARLSSVLFLFGKKKNQKVQASSMRHRLLFEVSSDELAFGRVYTTKDLRSETALRVISGFLGALNFSMSACWLPARLCDRKMRRLTMH
jgi:hypothetical protein